MLKVIFGTGREKAAGDWKKHSNKEIKSDVHVTVHRDKFLKIKPTRCTNFSNLFRKEHLHVSDSSSLHHQEFFTVHTLMVYVIHFFRCLANRFRLFQPDSARKLSENLCDTYH